MLPENIPSMKASRQTFDAGKHRNVVIPNSIFTDQTKEYHVLMDSPLGKAAIRLSFGSPIDISDNDDSEDNEGYETQNVSGDDVRYQKKQRNSFWPEYIDLVKGGKPLSYLCKERLCNEENKNIIRRMVLWEEIFQKITRDVKKKYPFGEESCREQLAMLTSIGDICNSIAASGLPISIMGAKQIMKHLKHPKSMQEAELVENMAEFKEFELTAHMSPCHTTFFVVTTHISRNSTRKHVIYGIFPMYMPSHPCPVEKMILENSDGFDGFGNVIR